MDRWGCAVAAETASSRAGTRELSNRGIEGRWSSIIRGSEACPLFVAQALNGIEACGPDGGHHSADDANQAEDERGRHEAGDVDVEVDVAGLQVVTECAHEG